MTQDEIIELAREANILEKMGYENQDMKNWRGDVLRELSVFAKLVAEKEREACAKVCDARAIEYDGFTEEQNASEQLAEAIRARNNQ